MKTVWNTSLQTESLRLLHAAHNIANGFYSLNHFLVLPYPQKHPPANSVIIPSLNYLSIPRFWQKASRIDIRSHPNIIVQASPQLVNQTQTLLAKAQLPPPSFSVTQSRWTKHAPQIISQIYKIIPNQANSVSSLEIWPTVIGTSCSFNLSQKPPHSIQIWLREDQGIATIVEAMLTSLTRHSIYSQLGGNWTESEIIVDWLISTSPLATLLKHLDPTWQQALTIKNLRRKQFSRSQATSSAFLAAVQAPIVTGTAIRDLPFNGFSHQEKSLIELLVAKSPQLVSFDEIADRLYATNPETFSLYAIAKTVQRLRDKLEKNGISASFIQTKRGHGYLLAN